jgi:hydroxymethylglutaryl-CoA lyase
MSHIEIVDVAHRDGLQVIQNFVPTVTKVELIRKIAVAGVTRIEVTSFVSPKHVPQMADAGEVVEALAGLKGMVSMVLVPNPLGAGHALKAGIRSLIYVISQTDEHNMSNVRWSTLASIDDLALLVEELSTEDSDLRVAVAWAFDCPFTGLVDESKVLRNIEQITRIHLGIEFAISDTTDMATPDHVERLCATAIAHFGDAAKFGFRGHDTVGFDLKPESLPSTCLSAALAAVPSRLARSGTLRPRT